MTKKEVSDMRKKSAARVRSKKASKFGPCPHCGFFVGHMPNCKGLKHG